MADEWRGRGSLIELFENSFCDCFAVVAAADLSAAVAAFVVYPGDGVEYYEGVDGIAHRAPPLCFAALSLRTPVFPFRGSHTNLATRSSCEGRRGVSLCHKG